MNILVTSAGRRTSLVLAFKQAAKPFGYRTLAADLDPLAPACALADAAFPVPRVTSPEYVPALLRICREQQVGVLVPTIDTELAVLAQARPAFEAAGVLLALSSAGFVAICGDKWRTAQAFQAEEIDVPRSWLPGELPAELPAQVFVKPRDGSASQHTYACSREELAQVLPRVPNAIVQERLVGPEVTVDALLDFDGRTLHFVPRERIRTLGGESIQGVTLDKPGLDRWLEQVLAACGRLGARGPVTLQAFETARGPVLSEINPRFGGGFPLAHAAGGLYPDWILALRRGEPVEPRIGQYRRGLYMTRHYTEIFLETLPWQR